MDRRFTVLLTRLAGFAMLLLLGGCLSTVAIQVRNGSLALNERLRADLQASDGMGNGRFYADGVCESSDANHECHFISPLRGSMVSALNQHYLHRLRRSNFFWVEQDGFAHLSYEFIGKGISVVDTDSNDVIAGPNIDVGTCGGFPALNPETRRPVPGMENVAIADPGSYLAQFDVGVQQCSAIASPQISEDLQPQTMNCSSSSVRDALQSVPPAPQTVPLCLTNVPAGNFFNDVTYSLLPSIVAGTDMQQIWPDLRLSPVQLLPHFKTVSANLPRTISRPLTRAAERTPNDDGSITYSFTWMVELEGERWRENFSPNVVVSRARVRRGAWTPGNRNYVELEALEVANVRCQVRAPDSNNIDFDIPQCDPSRQGTYRVTPAYSFDALNAGAVDDGARILWDARVRVPPTPLADNEQLFLELDLVSLIPVGTTGSGLYADPGGRDLGQVRVGPTAGALPAFTLHNAGPLSGWVESVSFTGRDAAEFGSVELRRTTGNATTVTAPFILSAGSVLQLNVRPNLLGVGTKQTTVAVRFHDVSNQQQTIMLGLQATGVAPYMNALPTRVNFFATVGATGHARAQRAALLTNDGSVPFQRLRAVIVGPHAGDFRVVHGEFGYTQTNVTQPLTLDPGTAEIYRMEFLPTVSGDREATLLIETSEGTQTIALSGHCSEHCDQPPPVSVKPVMPWSLPAAKMSTLTLKKTGTTRTFLKKKSSD